MLTWHLNGLWMAVRWVVEVVSGNRTHLGTLVHITLGVALAVAINMVVLLKSMPLSLM